MIFDAVDQEVIFDLPSRKGSVGVVSVVGWDDWAFVCCWTNWGGVRKENRGWSDRGWSDHGWSKECLSEVYGCSKLYRIVEGLFVCWEKDWEEAWDEGWDEGWDEDWDESWDEGWDEGWDELQFFCL